MRRTQGLRGGTVELLNLNLSSFLQLPKYKETDSTVIEEKTRKMLAQLPGASDCLMQIRSTAHRDSYYEFSDHSEKAKKDHRLLLTHCEDVEHWCLGVLKSIRYPENEEKHVEFNFFLVPATPHFKLQNVAKFFRKILHKPNQISFARIHRITENKKDRDFVVDSIFFQNDTPCRVPHLFMTFIHDLDI